MKKKDIEEFLETQWKNLIKAAMQHGFRQNHKLLVDLFSDFCRCSGNWDYIKRRGRGKTRKK